MRTSTVRRSFLALTLAAVASGCGPQAATEDAATEPPPPVIDMPDPLPNRPTDGHHRVIVTPPSDETPAAADAMSGTTEQASGATDRRWAVDPSRLDELPANATIVFREGVAGYVDVNGDFVPLTLSAQQPTQAPSETPNVPALPPITVAAGDRAFVAELSKVDGVQSVRPIGDGTYAVTTSSAETLTGLGLIMTEDAPFAFSAEPYEGYQWALDNSGVNLNDLAISPLPLQIADADLDGSEVVAEGPTGDGVIVAVIDSGVDFTHPDLSGSSWINSGENCGNALDDDNNGFIDDCRGWDFAGDDNESFSGDNDGHGTHVAGIITAASRNRVGIAGLAPSTEIMDLNVATQTSGGPTISASSIARAIRYAVDNGAHVINLSLASAPGAPAASVAPIVAAVEHAEANDVLVVVAAGNNGVDLAETSVYPASIDASNVLVVGASTPGDDKAGFSNFGSTVDLFAPGDMILSTVPGTAYAFQSGTSQASPLTAASAALVLENRPGADPETVIDQLVGTADEIPAFAGLAANAVRLNAARAAGLDPDDNQIVIRGLAAADLDGVHADIEIADVGGQFNQPFHWEATLLAFRSDGSYALVEHPVVVGSNELSTNERGAVELADDEASNVSFTTLLPVGSYGLMVEAVPRTDSTVRLGEAHLATFTIGDPAAEPSESSDPPAEPVDDSSSSDDSDPTGAQPPSSDQAGDPEATSSEPDPGAPPSPAESNGPTATPTATPTEPSPGSTDGTEPAEVTPDPGNAPSTTTDRSTPSADASGATPDSTPDSISGTNPNQPGGEASEPQSSAVPEDPPSASTPVVLGPDEATNGDWSIDQITPREGEVLAATSVSISGEFPKEAYVWFGDQPATVYSQTETSLQVRTPRRAEPGVVEVTLRTRGEGIVLTVPNAFVYRAVGDEGTVVIDSELSAPPSESSPSAPSVGEDPPDADFTPDPSSGPELPETDAVGGRDNGNGNGNGPSPQRNARNEVTGDPVDLGNGLRGVAIEGIGQAGGVPACTSDPCRTRRV